MAQAALPAVGTKWHTLKIVFVTNQISLYFDGLQINNLTDDNFDGLPPYLSGGITADMSPARARPTTWRSTM